MVLWRKNALGLTFDHDIDYGDGWYYEMLESQEREKHGHYSRYAETTAEDAALRQPRDWEIDLGGIFAQVDRVGDRGRA